MDRHRHTEVSGLDVHVFDRLFTRDEIKLVFATLNDVHYESPPRPDAKPYRAWACDFDPEDFGRHTIFDRTRSALDDLYAPADVRCESVTCSNITFGDFLSRRRDDTKSHRLTAIYFANPLWKRDWAAEAVFFDRHGDAAASISPKPGRLLVFDARLQHRMGIPARQCHLTSVMLRFGLVLRRGRSAPKSETPSLFTRMRVG